jgi:hypothetical protein
MDVYLIQDIRHGKGLDGAIEARWSLFVTDRPTPKTMSVPDAGRVYYDLGKNASYAAARRGEIVTIRVGRLLRVPVIAMERRLAEADAEAKPQ